MQVAYQEEAEDMESIKKWTLSLCNKRTKLYEPAKNPFPALVQRLFRPRFCREIACISIDGTIYGVAGKGFFAGSYSFVRLLHRLRVHGFKLSISSACSSYATCIGASFVPA